MTNVQAHKILLERYRAGGMKSDSAGGWSGLREDGYIHEHLCWHLAHVRRIPQENQRSRVLRALVEALVTHKRVEQALMVMREMQGPIIGSTLNKIAPQLTEGQLRDVLHLVGEIDVMKDRASALVSVVPYLSPALLLEALNMIHEITDVPERVVALTEISAYLSVDRRWELLTQAHTLVAGISQPSERIRALVSIAHKWEPSEERTRLLQSVEETLLAVRDVTRWWK